IVNPPRPEDFARLLWWYVAYLGSFTMSYLFWRRRNTTPIPNLRRPRDPVFVAMVALLLVLTGYFFAVSALYGVDFNPSYTEGRVGGFDAMFRLPILVQQLSNNLYGMIIVAKLGILTLMIARWSSRKWRLATYGWLVGETLLTVWRLGARTELVMLF